MPIETIFANVSCSDLKASEPWYEKLFGRAADRYGRRSTLAVVILTYSVLAFASGFAQSLMQLLILRALFGIAMGGEWGVGASLAMESIPPKARGFVSGILQSGYPSGYLVASVVYGLLYQYIGWRGMFMIGIAPAFLTFYILKNVKESPTWTPKRESAADALPTHLLARKQILQIASRPKHGGVAVKDVMRDAKKAAVEVGYQRVNRLVGIKETSPCHPGDVQWHRSRAGPRVESVVAVPKRPPLVVIGARDGTYCDYRGHCGSGY